jgi:hypothetical protein
MVNISAKEFRCPVCNQKLPFRVVASMLNRLNRDRTGVCPSCGTLLRYYTGNIMLFGLMIGLGGTVALLCYYAYQVTGGIIYDIIGLFSFLGALTVCFAEYIVHAGIRAVGSRKPK